MKNTEFGGRGDMVMDSEIEQSRFVFECYQQPNSMIRMEFELDLHASLDEVLYKVRQFLVGAGYEIEGSLEEVPLPTVSIDNDLSNFYKSDDWQKFNKEFFDNLDSLDESPSLLVNTYPRDTHSLYGNNHFNSVKNKKVKSKKKKNV